MIYLVFSEIACRLRLSRSSEMRKRQYKPKLLSLLVVKRTGRITLLGLDFQLT